MRDSPRLDDASESSSETAAAVQTSQVRTLRYRELFTGMAPYRTKLETWTLVLAPDGRMKVDHEVSEAAANNLRVGLARPLGPTKTILRESHAGRWTSGDSGRLDLVFDRDAGADPFSMIRAAVHCIKDQVAVLEPNARLVVPPHVHAPWKPSRRQSSDVLRCERAWMADPATWEDEPQPKELLFADAPGIEYAHDNDDMVVQQGGLRRIDTVDGG
jgi:hypothetical protein